MKYIYGLLIIGLLSCFSQECQADDIIVEKPGALYKRYKKTDVSGITQLTVVGTLNDKDWQTIMSMSNLQFLDLGDLSFKGNCGFEFVDRNNKEHDVPLDGVKWIHLVKDMKNLRHLVLPQWCSRIITYLPENETQEIDTLECYNTCPELGQMRPMVLIVRGAEEQSLSSVNLGYYDKFQYQNHRIVEYGKRSSKYWDGSYDYTAYRRNSNLQFRVLSLPSRGYLFENFNLDINPTYIELRNESKILVNWGSRFVEDEPWLKDYRLEFLPFAFQYTNEDIIVDQDVYLHHNCFTRCSAKTIRIKSTEEIPYECFSECKVSEIELGSTNKIGENVFEWADVKKLHIGKIKVLPDECFVRCSIEELVLDGVEDMKTPFRGSSVSKMVLKMPTAPLIQGVDGLKRTEIVVPSGAKESYRVDLWKNLSVSGDSDETDYKFSNLKPGGLIISLDIANAARSITLEGVLYDTDVLLLNKCKQLRNLDLGNAVILYSPETKKEQAKKLAEKVGEQLALFQLLGVVTHNAENKSASENKYLEAKWEKDLGLKIDSIVDALGKLSANLDNIDYSSEEWKQLCSSCIFPRGLDLPMLKSLVFPKTLEEIPCFMIDSENMLHLERVVLPLNVKKIAARAFNNCINLESIELPATITEIGTEAFNNCLKLKSVVLPDSLKEVGDRILYDCESLEVLDMRNVSASFSFPGSNLTNDNVMVKKVWFPKNYHFLERGYKSLEIRVVEGGDCYFPETFEQENRLRVYGENLKIHIPKGCRAGWAKVANKNVKIIDDL